MDALEEESFALSFSSASDAEFDAVVGCLEDIIMDDEFQLLQRNFMDKYYQEFEDTEENKLTYTPIFNEYRFQHHLLAPALIAMCAGTQTHTDFSGREVHRRAAAGAHPRLQHGSLHDNTAAP
ncbi:ADP-ribosylation factor-like protein 2-binding protein isoform X5 [Meriones unguiculatus]|uniref:ADP-ribosylation factor-like protein 2-binding protein isoform X5 n=1 Tax=Meriones unguiculatus TaxID=10047 RepID=UPI00293E627D|nr:ADP-ribosylation factor-like protein 2-binding protein isoform X5 [Meriones unguiculatus]